MTFEEFDKRAKGSFEEFDAAARKGSAPVDGKKLIQRGIISSAAGTRPAGAAEELEHAATSLTTPMGIGAAAGTAAAGLAGIPFPVLRRFPALLRILGGTVGGAAGGAMVDEPVAGAAFGLATTAAGEAGGKVVGKVLRSTRGAEARIAAKDAKRFGQAAEEVAPTLKPGRTADDFQRTAEGPGLERIGKAKEAAVQDIEGRIAGGQPGTFIPPGEIPVPSLTVKGGGARVTPGADVPVRRGVYGEETVDMATANVSPVDTLFSERPRSTWSLRDANAALSEIGDMMRGRKPLDPRFKDVDLSQLYGQIANDIREGIRQVGGEASVAIWNKAQKDYGSGRAVLDLLERQGLFRQGKFTMADLQRWLKDPSNRADLAKGLGGNLRTGENLGDYNRLVDAITRGAGPGMADELAGRAPGLFSGRGSYGAWRVPAEVVRALFPNASSRYVGRQPYGAPASIQALIDMALQGGAGMTADEARR